MARKSGSTISQEELYPPPDESVREEVDDARLLDLDADEEAPFLRGQKRVSARRSTLPKKTATRLIWGAIALTVLVLCGVATAMLYDYGEHSWRFRVASSDDIEIAGLQNVTRSQVMEVMGADIGRNIFFIPLAQQKKQLEQIPWVESASVMRFVPNHLRIEIQERTPVAFARVGSKVMLIDAAGTLMDLPGGKKKYSFPVILGMNPNEPMSTRMPRMKIYNDLVSQLDADGGHYSQALSEVDISDADDVKVLANDPDGEVLVHLGSSDYLERYKIYVAHVREWRQQFAKVDSVDLRYDRQIVVNPDMPGPKPAPLSLHAAKLAMAAGVKPASLISHETIAPKAANSLPAATAASKPPVKAVANKPAVSKPVAGKPAANHVATSKPVAKKKGVRTAHGKPSWKKAHSKMVAASARKPATAPAQKPAPKTNSVASAQPVIDPSKKKPSPAIAKSQENP
ncbi:MAG: FtsQ-type POTRA domain-containing protein [Terriglobales bacterium]|jgi:cell division protein FtsQ